MSSPTHPTENPSKSLSIKLTKKVKKIPKSLGDPYEQIAKKIDLFKKMGITNIFFKCNEGLSQNTTIIEGKHYVNFTSYDYLGLSSHPHTHKRAMDAIEHYGTSCSSSRSAGGEKKIHRELEGAIAQMLGVEDAIVFVGGYTTNVSTISHLFTEKDLILYDALSHNSILMGCLLSGARRMPFAHNNPQSLRELLQEHRKNFDKALIVIEGVYSMDGDIPPIASMVQLRNEFDCWLMVDEAHSMGVIGATGKGISEYAGVDPLDVDIWMGTLSKTFASCGGYIAGSHQLIEYLKYTAPGFVYSVGISPGNAGAALGSLETMLAEPERVAQLQRQSALFLKLCRERGINTGSSQDSAVIPVITGDSLKALRLADQLLRNGVHVVPITYPAVEENKARLRFFINCTHTDEQIITTVDLIEKILSELAVNGQVSS